MVKLGAFLKCNRGRSHLFNASHMRALRFDKTGSLEELKIAEMPMPKCGPGEVLVQIKAAAINPSDIKNVQGKMHETTVPRTPGRDFAGVVIEGPGRIVGTSVFGTGGDLGFGRDGSHAEYLLAPASVAAPMPAGMSFADAAVLGLPYITAHSALVGAARLERGELVLVTGTTGAVGRAAVAIAEGLGARVIGTARSASKIPAPGKMAVAEWVDLEKEDLAEKVRALTRGRGVDVVFDLVGGEMFEKCVRSLAHHGRQVAIASGPERRVSFDLIDFYHNESRLFGVDSLKLNFDETGLILGQLVTALNNGTYKIPEGESAETVPLEKAIDTYKEIAAGTTHAKKIIVP
jgi:NADPH:quinone reductase